MDMNNIGLQIRTLRKTRNLYQNTLAEISGVRRERISNIEHGKYCPKITTAIKLADALGVTLDELVGRKAK